MKTHISVPCWLHVFEIQFVCRRLSKTFCDSRTLHPMWHAITNIIIPKQRHITNCHLPLTIAASDAVGPIHMRISHDRQLPQKIMQVPLSSLCSKFIVILAPLAHTLVTIHGSMKAFSGCRCGPIHILSRGYCYVLLIMSLRNRCVSPPLDNAQDYILCLMRQ